MKRGKVGAAIANLSGDPGGGVLQLQEEVVNKNKKKTVKEHLLDLHPRQRTIQSEAVIDNCEDEHIFHPVLFDRITGGLIRKSAMQLRGAAGPSATDAVQWKRFLTEHKQASNTLCQSVAGVARKLCTQHVAPDYINNLRDCRLIPLDKMPGIRPIGISEVLRRLIGKAALSVLKPYIREVAGNKQLSAGHEAGCEAAIHAIRKMFTDHECEGLLLVDAENAFNELNRQTALRNIQVLCPGFSKICTIFYREPSQLYLSGDTIQSEEGTTQGDPLAMPFFGVSAMPIINATETPGCKQVWIADDATGIGDIDALKIWWDKISTFGPSFGYYPNEKKTKVLVKPEFEEKAREIFKKSSVEVLTEGHRVLGSVVGSQKFVEQYVSGLVEEWLAELQTLSDIAKTEPQAALSCLTHGLQSKYTFLLRTTPDIIELVQPIQTFIEDTLLPNIFGRALSDELMRVAKLPCREGGLGIIDLTRQSFLGKSLYISEPLIESVVSGSFEPMESIFSLQQRRKNQVYKSNRAESKQRLTEVLDECSNDLKRMVLLASERGASA